MVFMFHVTKLQLGVLNVQVQHYCVRLLKMWKTYRHNLTVSKIQNRNNHFVSNSMLVSAFAVMYCLVPVNWNLLGEEVGKGTSNREDQGKRLVPVLWH